MQQNTLILKRIIITCIQTVGRKMDTAKPKHVLLGTAKKKEHTVANETG
jgi:hypothetical protein